MGGAYRLRLVWWVVGNEFAGKPKHTMKTGLMKNSSLDGRVASCAVKSLFQVLQVLSGINSINQ